MEKEYDLLSFVNLRSLLSEFWHKKVYKFLNEDPSFSWGVLYVFVINEDTQFLYRLTRDEENRKDI